MTTTTYIVAYPNPAIPFSKRLYPVTADPNSYGAKVLERLCDIYPAYRGDLSDATLWKVSGFTTVDVCGDGGQRLYEWITERDKSPDSEIRRYLPLESCFPDGLQKPSGDWVDIVVVTPEILEALDHLGDTDGNVERMKARLTFRRTLGGFNPSGPRYGRSSDRPGPPTALFDKSMAVLRFNLEHLEGFTPQSETFIYAFDLISYSAEIFDKEDTREFCLRRAITALLMGESKWRESMADGTVTPGGVWMEGRFAYLIFELQNTPGLGGDPFLQGLAVYNKIIKQEEYSKFCLRSNLPVVLLSMAGNRLEVATAVFTDAVYVDKLLSLDLHLGLHAQDNVLHVARVFMAINKCTEQLRELYRNLGTVSGALPNILYPNPTVHPLESPTKTIPALEFFSKLDHLTGTQIRGTVLDGSLRVIRI